MRLLFASANYQLPADLAAKYAEVEIVGILPTFEAVVTLAETEQAERPIDVVVLDALLDTPDLGLLTAIERLRAISADLRVVVLVRGTTQLDQVASAGGEPFLTTDPDAAAANLAQVIGLASKGDVALVIAVTGLQGGAGRTYLAQGLASALAERFPRRRNERSGVLLWEVDMAHPSIAFDAAFPVASTDHGHRTIVQILDADAPKGVVSLKTVEPSIIREDETRLGYDVLLAPYGIRETLALYATNDSIDDLARRLTGVLEAVMRGYAVIICDTGVDPFDPGTALALGRASSIVTVATPSPAGLRSLFGMRAIVSDMRATARAKVVINRADSRSDGAYTGYAREIAEGIGELVAVLNEDAASTDTWRKLADKLVGPR